MKRPTGKIFDYLILTIIVSVAVILTLFFNGNKEFQKYIVIGLSSIYIVWGIYHHKKEHTFYPQIILEYGLFGLMGTLIVIGLL